MALRFGDVCLRRATGGEYSGDRPRRDGHAVARGRLRAIIEPFAPISCMVKARGNSPEAQGLCGEESAQKTFRAWSAGRTAAGDRQFQLPKPTRKEPDDEAGPHRTHHRSAEQ